MRCIQRESDQSTRRVNVSDVLRHSVFLFEMVWLERSDSDVATLVCRSHLASAAVGAVAVDVGTHVVLALLSPEFCPCSRGSGAGRSTCSFGRRCIAGADPPTAPPYFAPSPHLRFPVVCVYVCLCVFCLKSGPHPTRTPPSQPSFGSAPSTQDNQPEAATDRDDVFPVTLT